MRDRLGNFLNTRFSIGAFYRLLVKEIPLLGVTKFIYLDSDTIVNLDIRELWDYPMDGHALAATPELEATRNHMITDKWILHSGRVSVRDYFCSGVLCIDLTRLDADFFTQSVNWLAENPQVECPDQDFLNDIYSKDYARLPEKFDSFTGVSRHLDRNRVYSKIYHYAGEAALTLNLEGDALDRLFFSYFVKTPWFDEKVILHMYECVRQIFTERQIFAAQVSTMMSGRSRIFFTPPQDFEMLKANFFVQDSEEIIPAKEFEAVTALIKSLKKSRGKKVAFVLVGNYPLCFQQLVQAGFVEGRDFINAALFLPDMNGVPANICRILKSL